MVSRCVDFTVERAQLRAKPGGSSAQSSICCLSSENRELLPLWLILAASPVELSVLQFLVLQTTGHRWAKYVFFAFVFNMKMFISKQQTRYCFV